MIGFLSGQAITAGEEVIILVGGVGYQLKVGASLKPRLLQASAQPVSVFVYTHVREDSLDLFGFETEADKTLFLALLTVSGVGPRTALAIVDQGRERVIGAVHQANVAFFAAVPRVGKKLAQKIIIELKSKLGGLRDVTLTPESQDHQDVTAALLNLGFAEADIHTALMDIDVAELGVAASIKAAIKKVSQS